MSSVDRYISYLDIIWAYVKSYTPRPSRLSSGVTCLPPNLNPRCKRHTHPPGTQKLRSALSMRDSLSKEFLTSVHCESFSKFLSFGAGPNLILVCSASPANPPAQIRPALWSGPDRNKEVPKLDPSGGLRKPRVWGATWDNRKSVPSLDKCGIIPFLVYFPLLNEFQIMFVSRNCLLLYSSCYQKFYNRTHNRLYTEITDFGECNYYKLISKAHCHSPSPIIVWHFRGNLCPYYHVFVAYFEAVSAVATAVTVFSGVTTIAVVAATKAGSWGKPREQLDFSTLWGSWETQVLVVPRAAYQSSKQHAAIRFLLSHLEYLWITRLVL